MKKIGVIVLTAALAALVAATGLDTASARPQYRKVHDDKYEGTSIEDALKEAKCNVCHYGKKKENHNDYGEALMKAGLSEEKFKELRRDREALTEYVEEAITKVLETKKPGTDKTTFGDLIEKGELPGTNPEGEDDE